MVVKTTATLTVTPNASAVAGTYFYRCVVSVNSCSSVTSNSATLTVNINSTIALTSGANSDAQTICQNTPLTPITYAIGGGGTGASITSGTLPAGVTGVFNNGVFTISGTPTVAGTFNYTITTSGPCVNPSVSGTITVSAAPSGTLNPSSTSICAGQNVTFTFSNATYGSYIFKLNGVGTPLQTGTSNIYNTSALIMVILLRWMLPTQTTAELHLARHRLPLMHYPRQHLRLLWPPLFVQAIQLLLPVHRQDRGTYNFKVNGVSA